MPGYDHRGRIKTGQPNLESQNARQCVIHARLKGQVGRVLVLEGFDGAFDIRELLGPRAGHAKIR